MKLFRFGPPGKEKPGVIDGSGNWLDVSRFGEDYGEAFFGTDGPARLAAWLAGEREGCPVVAETERIGPAVCRPSKIICVGLNYRAHAAETNANVPSEPVLFMKASSSQSGPFDDIVIPRGSVKTDWEIELAFVVGRVARYVKKEQAYEHVAGYMLHNDVSEREFQLERSGQWVKGKSADSFSPMGPFLATSDEIDPSNVKLWLDVNGKRMQDASTSDFIADIPTIIACITQYMTLLPGDVISTGTPAGVGMGQKPPTFLKPGDLVEFGGEGLGSARQKVVASGHD